MSEHKNIDEVVHTSGSGTQKGLPTRSHSTLLKLIIAGTVLAILGLGGYFLNTIGSHQPTKGKGATPALTPQQKVVNTALGYQIGGDPNKAVKSLDDAVANATSNDDKVMYLTQKAGLLCSKGQFETGLQAAKEAEAIKPSVSSAAVTAFCAEKKGDLQTAVTNYKLQLERAGTPKITGEYDEVKAKITELEKALGQ